MGYEVSRGDFDKILLELQKDYRVYVPKRLVGEGRYSDTDTIRYDGELTEEDLPRVVFDKKSTFSPREVILPLTRTVLYFFNGLEQMKDGEVTDPKPLLIFARACDIYSMIPNDDMFLKNGRHVDEYYEALRKKVHFALIECPEKGWDTCFCASMGGNKTDEYDFGVKVTSDKVSVEIKEPSMDKYFQGGKKADFKVTPVTENERKVRIPAIPDGKEGRVVANLLKEHPMWDTYRLRCIKCGSCTVACGTCTCFKTYDVKFDSSPEAGERRRVHASCMTDGFSTVAGGGQYRQSPGSRLCFKMLHKVYTHRARFGHDMCSGCGRCDERCPSRISFSTTINRAADAVDEINAQRAKENT